MPMMQTLRVLHRWETWQKTLFCFQKNSSIVLPTRRLWVKNFGYPCFGQVSGAKKLQLTVRTWKQIDVKRHNPKGWKPGFKWNERICFFKLQNSSFGQIFAHQRVEIYTRNTKMNRDEEAHPIRENARYHSNWVSVFLIPETQNKQFWKPCLQTDRRTTDRRQGESTIPYSTFGAAGG